jgi:hypothetical protein
MVPEILHDRFRKIIFDAYTSPVFFLRDMVLAMSLEFSSLVQIVSTFSLAVLRLVCLEGTSFSIHDKENFGNVVLDQYLLAPLVQVVA